jgi:hypothetical protein
MKRCTARSVFAFVLLSFIFCVSTAFSNLQTYHRWDFDSGKEGWEASGTSTNIVLYTSSFNFEVNNGKLETERPSSHAIDSLYFKYVDDLSQLENITIYLTSSYPFYIQAYATKITGKTVKTNIIHQSPADEYQKITLTFDTPILISQEIYIDFNVKNSNGNFKMSVDWIEVNSSQKDNEFDLTIFPPGNVIQKGKEGEFTINANWTANQNIPATKMNALVLSQNNFNLMENSPHGEILDVVVGETTAQAKFLFTAQELGEHLVNFTATLENVPGNPLEITKQLPIFVTDFDPNTLFNQTSTADNWMLYPN